MIWKRLGIFIFSHVVCLGLAVNPALVPEAHTRSISPPQQIITLDNSKVPNWKIDWDSARERALHNDYETAAEYYQKVLEERRHIEEAKWEYSKVLFILERFQEASLLLEGLIEDNPNNDNYLALAGYVALETEEYSRAVTYLGQVYSSKPAGEEGVRALRGLIEGLLETGKVQYAFVLMEQLLQRVTAEYKLLLEAARTAKEIGNIDKALKYYSAVIELGVTDEATLRETAMFYSTVGVTEKAAPIWEKLSSNYSGALEYHKQLYSYYQGVNKHKEALPHLLMIVEAEGEISPELYLEAARMYFHEMNRADKSLTYYEKYLTLVPDDVVAEKELAEARFRISNDLLAIVENDGAKPLWNDLRLITENRLVIYRLMAEELEKKNKTHSLIQVNEILYNNSSTDKDTLALKLAELYLGIEEYKQAYSYLSKVTNRGKKTYSYHKKRAEVEFLLGYDISALDSLISALNIRPSDNELLKKSVILSGQLGDVDLLKKLGKRIYLSTSTYESSATLFAYLDALQLNGQYSTLDTLYSDLIPHKKPDIQQKLLLHKATTAGIMGLQYKSQQELRQIVSKGMVDPAVISELINYALLSESTSDSRALLSFYNKNIGNEEWKKKYDKSNWRLFNSYLNILKTEGNIQRGISELNLYREGLQANSMHPIPVSVQNEVDVELCGMYMAIDEQELCDSILKETPSRFEKSYNEKLVRQIIFSREDLNSDTMRKYLPEIRTGNGGVRHLFILSGIANSLGYTDTALDITNEILHIYPQSIRARIATGQLYKKLGRFHEASTVYRGLWQDFPLENLYFHEYLQLQFKQGRYVNVLTELDKKDFDTLPVDLQLLKTRTLWALDDKNIAFSLYEQMLTPPVQEVFREKLADNSIQFKVKNEKKKSIWDVFRYEKPDQLDKLNSIRGKKGFLANATSPVGEVTADLYYTYRWQEHIANEYSIRKAVDEKKYIAAEKQYRKKIEKEKNTEGLKDLAKIYERLGDYDKEAEIYDYLQREGENTAEIEDSIKRNQMARAPTLSLRGGYQQREGRDNQINIEKTSSGVGFRYLPTLKSSLELSVDNLTYDAASGDGASIDGLEFSSKMTYVFDDSTSIEVDLGLHDVNSGGKSTPLYRLRINQQFDQLLSGYVELDQQIIDDTTVALKQSLDRNSITAGIVLEGPLGVNLGGEFSRIWFDNDNDQNRLFFWSSYTIFSELTTYEMKYSYELLNNKEGSGGNGSREALPYWSPSEYWLNLFSLRIDHMLGEDKKTSNPPSHCSLELGLGYESEDDFIYNAGFDIFLEISSNILLKGELSYSNSSDYEEKGAALSVIYRW